MNLIQLKRLISLQQVSLLLIYEDFVRPSFITTEDSQNKSSFGTFEKINQMIVKI